MGEERQQAVVAAQLAEGHVQQRRVAAVTVEEDEPPGRRHRRAPTEVVEHGQERRSREPDRARRPGVLVRLAVGQRRQQPGVDLVAPLGDGRLGDVVGDHQVGVERQVRAVLLDGADRLHEDRALRQQLGHLRVAQLRQPATMQWP